MHGFPVIVTLNRIIMIEAQKHGSTRGYVNQLFLMNFSFIAQFWPQIQWADPDGHLLHGVLLCPLLCKLVVFLTVSFEDASDLRDQGVVRVGVTEQRAHREQDLADSESW